ncbi:MAG: hypothetical protein J6R18_00275, partial [Kiritimatiellae bacterium]|nr:hypothetical protein [Kiritimatiellia bacterium]
LNTYSGHLYRETNTLDDVVFDCVLASTAVKGTHQLAGPAVGDWRPLADSDAIGAGRYSHLETLSLPDGIDAFKDFEGNAIEADANGGVNAGAIQSKMTPAGGALHFWYDDNNLVYEINGYKTENKYETWVYPEVYPTQYCVKVQLTDGKHLYRISRKNPSDGNDSIDYPAFVPYRDGTMWMMPPIGPAMSITNTVEKAAAVFYVDDDPEKASDEEGDGSADKPFLSIQKAIDTVETLENPKTKTLIYLNPGVYTNGIFEEGTRGRFRIGVSNTSRYIRIVSTEGAEKTIICGAADPDTEDGLGPKAIKGVHPDRNFILQDVMIADCYTDKDNKTWDGGTYGAAVYGTSSPSAYPPQFVDVVITNCHAYKSVGINYVVYKRCKFLDCSSLTEYAFADSQKTKQQFPMFACYSRNVTLHDTSSSAFGLVGGSAQIYQCTFTRELGKGRLTGGANVSYNTIWYGGKNIYSTSVFTNCIVYNPKDEANGTYRKVDPLLFDNTVDGTLCFDSPAIASGELLAVDNFGSNFWRYACGDINGNPIVFADGKATLGAFQTIANVVNVNVAESVDGGWKLTAGLDYGSFRLSEGQSISFVTDECARNCLGIKAGDREFRFDGNGSIVLGFDAVAQLPVKTFEAWYSTNWYVSANTDAAKGAVGNDDNDGFTPETPKRTLAAAATLLYPGDVLHVAPGCYDEGEDVYDTQTTPNRVVVKSNTSVIADEGPDVTFIVGGVADGKVMRCAYVDANAKLSGFTLTGGTNDVASAYNNDPNAMGGAIIGAGRSSSSIVENCVISNSYGNVGTAALCDLIACKVMGNRAMSQGCGVRQGNAYGCFFDGNVGKSVLSYCQHVWNCTITTNNVTADGAKSTSIASLINDGTAINTYIGYKITTGENDKILIDHCVVG